MPSTVSDVKSAFNQTQVKKINVFNHYEGKKEFDINEDTPTDFLFCLCNYHNAHTGLHDKRELIYFIIKSAT